MEDRRVVEHQWAAPKTLKLIVIPRLRKLLAFDSDDIPLIDKHLAALGQAEALGIGTKCADIHQLGMLDVTKLLETTIAAIKTFLQGHGFPLDVITELSNLLKVDFSLAVLKVQEVKVILVEDDVCVLLLVRIEIKEGQATFTIIKGKYSTCSRLYSIVFMHPKLLVDDKFFDALMGYMASSPWAPSTDASRTNAVTDMVRARLRQLLSE